MRKKALVARQPFRFGWEVPEDGYRCEPGFALDDHGGSPKSELMLLESTPVGVSRTVRRHQTLNENTGLFLDFAKVDATPEGITAFANRYGALGGNLRQMALRRKVKERSVYAGEPVAAWITEIDSLRRLLPAWDPNRKAEVIFKTSPEGILAESPTGGDVIVHRGTDPDTYERLRDNTSLIAQHYLRMKVNAKLLEHPSTARLIYERSRGDLALFIVPSSLIAAIWLQFAAAIDGNRKYRSCKNCARWFEIGSGVRRADAEVCSDTCRAAFAWKKQQTKKRG